VVVLARAMVRQVAPIAVVGQVALRLGNQRPTAATILSPREFGVSDGGEGGFGVGGKRVPLQDGHDGYVVFPYQNFIQSKGKDRLAFLVENKFHQLWSFSKKAKLISCIQMKNKGEAELLSLLRHLSFRAYFRGYPSTL